MVSLIYGVTGFYYLMLFIMIVATNTISFLHLRKSDKSEISNSAHERSRKQKLKSVQTLLMITVVYATCYLPYTIQIIVGQHIFDDLTRIILGFLFASNFSLNSIVYILRNKSIRLFYYCLLTKCCRKCTF